jgi:hypothetical protein
VTVSPRYYPEDAVQEMIAAEREACAKIIDDLVESEHDFDDNQWWIDDTPASAPPQRPRLG